MKKIDSVILYRYQGCFLGLALGDALGARYEGGVLERALWKLIGKSKGRLRYTDDTQMSLDIASLYVKNQTFSQDDLAKAFAASYQWSRGYGPGMAKILKRIRNGMPWYQANRSVYEAGSYGNGAAMRAPIIALCYPDKQDLRKQVKRLSEITHAHPQAIEGAQLIACATRQALDSAETATIVSTISELAECDEYLQKLHICKEVLSKSDLLSLFEIKKQLGNGMIATESCVTAIYFALFYRDKPFMQMIDAICALGGDADTIAAMAGGIWGAFNGAEFGEVDVIEGYEEIEALASSLFASACKGVQNGN